MGMNRRTVQLVKKLSHDPLPCTLSDLARELEVTERTIRSDIKTLNAFLASNSLEPIRFGSRGVVLLPKGFDRVEELLPVDDSLIYKMSREERQQLAAAMLVGAEDYLTLGNIAETFSVSRATILNDLDGIKELIRDAGLEVESKPSRGVRVRGSEGLRRKFLLTFVSGGGPTVDQWRALPDNAALRDDEPTVRRILNERCHAYGIFMPDRPFRIQADFLAICVLRSRAGHALDGLEEIPGSLSHEDVGNFERETVELVSQYCSVELGPDDALLLTSLGQTLRYQGDTQFNVDEMYVQKLSRVFIRSVSEHIGIDLTGDYDLFEYLSNHLESMFTTDPSHFPENEAIVAAIEGHPAVRSAVEDNLAILEEHAGRIITPVEIMYVALHFCAALERRRSRRVRPRVVVVCDGGVGTSQLLAEELRSRFNIKIVKVIPAHDIPYIESYHADLVISTVPLDSCPVEHVVIGLPLREREYRLVHDHLALIEPTVMPGDFDEEELSPGGLLDRIEPILRAHAPGDEELIKKIRLEVRHYFHEIQQIEDDLIAPFLHQLLPASHIELDVACADWRDAVGKSAQLLLRMGYIEERYIRSMIDGMEKYGPYSVLVPGFAVSHSAPENGTVKMGMSLIRLREPVNFGSAENDPIDFVCTLSAVDRKMHLKAFANLLDMLTQEGGSFLEELRAARTPEEAALVIESNEFKVL